MAGMKASKMSSDHICLLAGAALSLMSPDMYANNEQWMDRLPDILIVYADDQGCGDCSLRNPDPKKYLNPYMNQLARDGMRFTDGQSSSGVCTPSRYALLMGRYHWHQGEGIVNSWGGPWWGRNRLKLPEVAAKLRAKLQSICSGASTRTGIGVARWRWQVLGFGFQV
jgi:hypothetical protein